MSIGFVGSSERMVGNLETIHKRAPSMLAAVTDDDSKLRRQLRQVE